MIRVVAAIDRHAAVETIRARQLGAVDHQRQCVVIAAILGLERDRAAGPAIVAADRPIRKNLDRRNRQRSGREQNKSESH